MKIRPKRAVWLLLALSLAMYAASRTTGAGWLVVLVAVVVALVAVGTVSPIIGVVRASLEAAAPPDATTGRPFPLTFAVGRSSVVVTIALFDVEVGAVGPVTGSCSAVAPYRGVWKELHATVECGAPFGLLKASRDVVIPLGRELTVAPAAAASLNSANLADAVDRDGRTSRGHSEEGTVASLAEYRPGDPLRRIHWAASARHGDLLVKQLEPPITERLIVVAELSGGPYAQEEIAGRVLGIVGQGLRAGLVVELWTRSVEGMDRSIVTTSLHAGRLLAHAIAGRVTRPSDESAAGRVVTVSA